MKDVIIFIVAFVISFGLGMFAMALASISKHEPPKPDDVKLDRFPFKI